MIADQITVTVTPTSIKDLLEAVTARTTAVPDKCVGIMLRYAKAETAFVTLSDEGNKTGGVVVLDAATEVLIVTSLKQFNSSSTYLRCNTGTVTVHVILEQALM